MIRKLLVAVIVVLSALAIAAQAPTPSPQPASLWIDVPFIKQTPEACGAASIAMVMRYWAEQSGRHPGSESDPEVIFKQLHSREARGIYASKMQKYLEEQGFRTFAIRGSWSDLRQHLDKGRPLIVALRPLRNSDALHYVVVVGIDDAKGLVIFNDPADRKLAKLDRESFEKEWSATEQWTLLAVPQSDAR